MRLSHSDRSARNLILSTLFLLGMNLSPFSNKEICASVSSWRDRFVTNLTVDGDCLGKSPCLATESFFLFAVFLMEWSSWFLLSSIEAFSVDDPDPWFFAPSVALPVNSNQSLPDGDRVFCAGFLSGFRWSAFTKLKWQLSYNSRIVENKLKCEKIFDPDHVKIDISTWAPGEISEQPVHQNNLIRVFDQAYWRTDGRTDPTKTIYHFGIVRTPVM